MSDHDPPHGQYDAGWREQKERLKARFNRNTDTASASTPRPPAQSAFVPAPVPESGTEHLRDRFNRHRHHANTAGASTPQSPAQSAFVPAPVPENGTEHLRDRFNPRRRHTHTADLPVLRPESSSSSEESVAEPPAPPGLLTFPQDAPQSASSQAPSSSRHRTANALTHVLPHRTRRPSRTAVEESQNLSSAQDGPHTSSHPRLNAWLHGVTPGHAPPDNDSEVSTVVASEHPSESTDRTLVHRLARARGSVSESGGSESTVRASVPDGPQYYGIGPEQEAAYERRRAAERERRGEGARRHHRR